MLVLLIHEILFPFLFFRCQKGEVFDSFELVYYSIDSGDGNSFFVNGIWPSCRERNASKMDAWLKDVAPSKRRAAMYFE